MNLAQSEWSPERYARFREERTQPFRDLLAGTDAIPGGAGIDLGCGTGDLTRILHQQSQANETIGVDLSAAMLSAAEPLPGLSLSEADLATFEPERKYDLVFSNAALQWLPDHAALFARIANWIEPGGQLAVQMPANHRHPSHTVAGRLAAEEFGVAARTPSVELPDWYATLLDDLKFAEIRVRLSIYLHHLPSREAVVEWVEGTLLNAYRNQIGDFDRYLARYREELLALLPDKRPFPFTFPRILMWATKS